jgi:O-methyltransferase
MSNPSIDRSSRLSDRLIWSPRLTRLRRAFLRGVETLLARKYAYVTFHSDAREVFDLIRTVKQQSGMLIRDSEAYQMWTAAAAAQSVSGSFAEFGVYNGGSAKLLCELKGDRPLHLFDSFEGLPPVGPEDRQERWQEGWFRGSREAVERLLDEYDEVHIHQGIFPATASAVSEERFAFVHLDVDIYESTLQGLQFFYPRLNPGGMLLSHDYQPGSSVQRAFEDYFADQEVAVIPLPPRYVMVVGR